MWTFTHLSHYDLSMSLSSLSKAMGDQQTTTSFFVDTERSTFAKMPSFYPVMDNENKHNIFPNKYNYSLPA